MKNLIIAYLVILSIFLTTSLYAEIIVVSSKDNRFIHILNENKIPFSSVLSIDQALSKAKLNDGIMLINDPILRNKQINSKQQSIIRNKGLKVYVEYPYYKTASKPSERKINLERAVINTDKIQGTSYLSIFSLNDQQFYEYKVAENLVAIAKVAGFDKAEYGLSNTIVYPGLFKSEEYLISSVSLSNFNSARFGPQEVVSDLWNYIFKFLGLESTDGLEFKAEVHPRFKKDDSITVENYYTAVKDGTSWYYNSGLLVHPKWASFIDKYTNKNGEHVVHPRVPNQQLVGDGSLGILEGHASYIQSDGSQPIRWWLRGDCQAETAFALSSAANLLNNPNDKKTAINLLDYLYKTSNLRANERNDPKSTSFGLIGWATTDPDAYYGDDNARTLLATIGASYQLETEDYYPYIIEGILGNFRTAGVNGFRGPWFRDAKLQTLEWTALYNKDIINYHPHYESWLWANYLWLYDKTGFEPLKIRAKKAIELTMTNFPNWKWTNGIQQEYARMILPLAWLVRVEDTELHRYWLKMIVNVLLQDLDESGAIKEKLGQKGLGRYDKVPSNADYGLKEAPLISDYGDKVSDLLYTINFASFGLNEAYAATGDDSYKNALNKINEFFVRIQVSSSTHKDLHGAWFRAFDFGRWDYWASNADSGWGPWGTQTGWTQSWILNSLTSHLSQDNFWAKSSYLKNNSGFQNLFQSRLKSMLPNIN